MSWVTDILIVTATRVESKAVIDAFQSGTGHAPSPVSVGERVYHNLGTINGATVFMVQSEMGTSGLGASMLTVQKGVAALCPKAVIMVGIAFGINPEKQAIGDVLVSQRLMLYDLQRISTDETGHFRLIPRGDRPHASPWLFNKFQSTDLYLDEKKARVHFGLVLSGEKLVDNFDFRQQLHMLEPEAIGGEMEGAGLYIACQDAKVDWILVKAICDWADGHKAQDREVRQRLAADNAANFVLHALQQTSFAQQDMYQRALSDHQAHASQGAAILGTDSVSPTAEIADSVIQKASEQTLQITRKRADLDLNGKERNGTGIRRVKFTADQRDDFAGLIVASKLTDQRKALCIRIGLDPDELAFVEHRASLDFAIELIADCEKKELDNSLLRLLNIVKAELDDNKKYQAKLAKLYTSLGFDALHTEIDTQSSPNGGGCYPDTHIISVLQVWSPLTIVWLLLLLLLPAHYEKYLKRFRASTARNIHISACCLLTYLPLLFLALGVASKHTSSSENSGIGLRAVWLAVVIAWLTTLVIGQIDSKAVGDLIGLIIGVLVSVIIVAMTPYGLSLGILNWVCISITGGTAYAVALSTINDRNVPGAGIGAAISAVLLGLFLGIYTGQIMGGLLVFMIVVGAMAVHSGVLGGLQENIGKHRTSKRSVFALVMFAVSLAALVTTYIDIHFPGIF